MGMPATAANEFTFEMWEALPEDGNRYEIIDGELVVNAAPRNPHQATLSELHRQIANYLYQYRVARVLFSPADIRIDRSNLVQPDLFVVERSMREWREMTSLLLAVEVLSPTTAQLDRVRKRPLYQRFNVPEYWIVDADARLIERWRPSDERPEILEKSIEWQPSTGSPPLVIDLPLMFREALDE